LAGKGLVEVFEKWAPRIAGASRTDMSRLYREQTGRALSDYILVQQADKVVRYNQLPPQAEVVRHALMNARSSPTPEEETRQQIARFEGPSEGASDFPTPRKARLNLGMDRAAAPGSPDGVSEIAAKKKGTLAGSKQRLLDSHDPNALLSTNELATLTGFKPKTIRRWVSRKLLNYIRVGNRFRFRLAAVELFLAQREVRK
jgi:excisionase family DNA binding protein